MADKVHVVSAVGPLVLRDDVPAECLLTFIDTVTDWNLFSNQKSGSLQEIIGHTHTCLGSSKHRIEGLLLLPRLVEQSSSEVFIKNVRTWINLLLQILQSHSPANHYSLTCQAINALLKESKAFSEITREMSTSFIPQLIPLLLGASEQWSSYAVSCVNSCLQFYPGPCGAFKVKVENFIMPLLDQEYPVKDGILCYALLAGSGGSGNMGIKHIESWTKQGRKLLSTLWYTLQHLYSGLEQDLPHVDDTILPLKPIPDKEPMRMSILSSRYQMLCDCFNTLLRQSFDTVTKVPLEEIVYLVEHTLNVNNSLLLSRPTTERVLLAYLLPSVHCSALSLISSLIVSTKKLLLPYSSLIYNLLTQSLVWTQSVSNSSGQPRQYSPLREMVYSVASDWMKVIGVCSDLGSKRSEFIQCIISDVMVELDELKIDSGKSKDSEGSSKKKKKGGGYQEISRGQGLAKKINSSANQKICYMALETLRWILTIDGTSLKTNVMKDVSSCLMEVSLRVQQSSTTHPPPPYNHHRCLLELYKVVVALVLVPHPSCPPPIHLAIRILKGGLHSNNIEVVGCCREGLTVVEAIIHPRAPCLQPAVKFTDPIILRSNSTNAISSVENNTCLENEHLSQRGHNFTNNFNNQGRQSELNSFQGSAYQHDFTSLKTIWPITAASDHVSEKISKSQDEDSGISAKTNTKRTVADTDLNMEKTLNPSEAKKVKISEKNLTKNEIESEPESEKESESEGNSDVEEEMSDNSTKETDFDTLPSSSKDLSKGDNLEQQQGVDNSVVYASTSAKGKVKLLEAPGNVQLDQQAESSIEQTAELDDMLSSFVDASPEPEDS